MRQLLLTAGLLLPLGLDTFALAAALGVTGFARQDRLRVALVFAIFEAGMPIAGVLAGRAAGNLVGGWAGWIGIAILAVAGLLLLRPGGDEDEGRVKLLAQVRGLALVNLGLSISLDELTVGFSAGLLGISIAVTVVWVAVQALVATQLGLSFGARIGERIRERSEQAAGLALLAVALIFLVLRLLNL